MPEKTISINRFDYGMGEDRTSTIRYAENVVLNKDNVKQVADVVGANSTRTLLKTITVGTDIYGLGQSTAGNNFALYKSTDYGATFSEINPAATGTFLAIENPFLAYSGGYIYFHNGIYMGRYKISDGSMVGDWITLSLGGDAFNGGIAFQSYLWGWHNNDIWYITDLTSANGTKFQSNAIPLEQTIKDLVPNGNLLEVICSSSTKISNSYTIDGVSSTFVEITPIGNGTVAGGALVDGIIKVVISTGAGGGTGFEIKYQSAGGYKTEFEYKGRKNNSGDNFTYLISRVKTYANTIYFLIGATRPGTTTTVNSFSVQLARYGNKLSGQQNGFSIYKDLNFVPSAITRATDRQNDFVLLDLQADYYSVFAAIQDNASTPTIKEIRTTTTFAQPGIIETGVMNGGNSSIEKSLSELSIMVAPLTTGQEATLKYKSNAETTFTEIHTLDTVGEISYEPVNQADGANLKVSKEVSFQISLTGGTEFTAFTARYEENLGQR